MKKVIFILVILTSAAIGVFGYTVLYDMFGSDRADRASDDSKNAFAGDSVKRAGMDRDAISGTVSDDELDEYEEQGLNPFGEDIALEELTDADIQEYIHGMSHQKVIAEEKWGFYELLPSRIKWLLDGLDETTELKHKEIYEAILKKWEQGDFSTVDKD